MKKALIVIGILILIVSTSGGVYYWQRSVNSKQKAENKRQQEDLQKKLSDAQKEIVNINNKLVSKEEEISNLSGQIAKTQVQAANEEEANKVLKSFLDAKKGKNYTLARSYMASKIIKYSYNDQVTYWEEDALRTEIEGGLVSYSIKEAGVFPTETTYKITIREQHVSESLDGGLPFSYNLDIPITLAINGDDWVISAYQIPQGLGKPAIYLYPEKTTKVSVKVNPDGGITYSDPAYGDGWETVASPDGSLQVAGKTYPYLFWEGNSFEVNIPKEGFVVRRDNVSSFLDEKLSYLGLNTKEIGDFKEFWLPRMGEKPYYFINFIPQKEIDKIAPIDINPNPDTIIRVLMYYKGLENPINVQEQQLVSRAREGFTAVEWGGIFGN
ncbi:MAG: hypothetical protein M1355_00700 [Patescibacteria group bacterium]|nr:hypothetical protein [Patescibacteria group bacterium]MCL5093645.1 hypothetical protein [Patescibacteria group bacterium]